MIPAPLLIPAINGGIAVVTSLIEAIAASDETPEEQKQHLLELKQRLDDTNAAVQAYKPRQV